jgi:serine/threonine protein kinase/CRP-like cAMP-binding protein
LVRDSSHVQCLALETFGRFRLLKRIGEGGMGEIFFARSASIDGFEKNLVIKRIRRELTQNKKFTSMFINEARVAINLTHANVVQVFDFGEADGCYYLAMEYVDGADTADLLDIPSGSKGLPAGIALYVMGEALKGLDYAHNLLSNSGEPLNIVHRDISPDNIMVSYNGEVKVTDFGVAKAKGLAKLEDDGTVVGKYPYMSPEHATGQSIDRRADVFSCGIVLWELLTGEPLYGFEVNKELMQRVATADVERPSKFNPDVPRRVDKLVLKALERKPEDRFSSAREFVSEIHDVLNRKYRGFDNYRLQSYVQERQQEIRTLRGTEFPATSPMAFASQPSSSASATSEDSSASQDVTPACMNVEAEVVIQAENFRKAPSLWRFVSMGDVMLKLDNEEGALSAYRAAGVKFAQHGLLAQSLLCAKRMLSIEDDIDIRNELGQWVNLVGKQDSLILPYLFRRGGGVEELLSDLLTLTITLGEASVQELALLRAFDPHAFIHMAILGKQHQFQAEQKIVEQGDQGQTMFLILSGRTVVYITDETNNRVYVASLSAGDFFGENSFFSGSPRSATVEALGNVVALEIDRTLYEKVMAENPEASSILVQFYKERVVDSIFAMSPIFGVLPSSQRRELMELLQLRKIEQGDVFMHEGEVAQSLYLVKNGHGRTYCADNGEARVLSEIGPGMMVGEMDVLLEAPRSASMIADSAMEVFQLDCGQLNAFMASSQVLQERLAEVSAGNV